MKFTYFFADQIKYTSSLNQLYLIQENFTMFPSSTQNQHWMFKNEDKINSIKYKTNREFIER